MIIEANRYEIDFTIKFDGFKSNDESAGTPVTSPLRSASLVFLRYATLRLNQPVVALQAN